MRLVNLVSRSGLPLFEDEELEWLGAEGGCWEERAREERRGLMVGSCRVNAVCVKLAQCLYEHDSARTAV